MNYKRLACHFFIILCCFKSAYATDSALLVENAWIAEAPPVSKVMVAYMTLKNTGVEPVEIVAAKSDLFSSIEFHETIHEDGMAKMVRHNSLNIPPEKSLQLKRGGQHLMLFNPAKPLKAGDTVNIRLVTKDDICQNVSVTVRKAQF